MTEKHPSLDITGSSSNLLEGKRIILCVTGSVAAYRSIQLARLLMRQGASVWCVLSPAAARLLTPEYMTWATGHSAITKLGGNMEHVELAEVGRADMIVVYPATANTIGKMASGIDDQAVSTVLMTGMGSGIPVMVCPAMHGSMYKNPAVQRNIKFLEHSVRFVQPQIYEGKAKVAEPSDVVDDIAKTVTRPAPLRGRRILLIAGPTMERIDPVRAITNMSTGLTGVLLASELINDGCDVTMIYGPGREKPPVGAQIISVTSVSEMSEATLREVQNGYEVVIMAAAASDYTPVEYHREKIGSEVKDFTITFSQTPKIIDRIKDVAPDVILVGFKAEANVTEEFLIESARQKLTEAGADLIIANDVGDGYQIDSENNRVIRVDDTGHRTSGRKGKDQIVRFIKEEIEEKWIKKNRR